MRARPPGACSAAVAKQRALRPGVGGACDEAPVGRPIAESTWRRRPAPKRSAPRSKAGIKSLPTGIAHGTVTAVVNSPGPSRHYEITTLRRDVETFGRHARVAFDAGWSEDAARRDFTINAIYLDPDGTVHDPMAGCATSKRAACALSASRPGASPRTCCGSCATIGSRRGSAAARAIGRRGPPAGPRCRSSGNACGRGSRTNCCGCSRCPIRFRRCG